MNSSVQSRISPQSQQAPPGLTPFTPDLTPLDGAKTAVKWFEPGSKQLGSSSCLYLHAGFSLNIYKNGEAVGFASIRNKEISGETRVDSPVQRNFRSGELHQSGLTSYAKRCMRVLAHEYQRMVTEPGSQFPKAYCSFTTLSFRRILPTTDVMAKEIFRSYLERVRRKKGNIHYVHVAEMQNGSKLPGGKLSYRLLTGVSAIHFHMMSPVDFETDWVNKAWNECVANRYLKEKLIDQLEYQQWMNEYDTHAAYQKRLARFKGGHTTREPRSPGIGTYMLTPNVRAVYQAGNYMAKYISKEGGKIAGHLWNMSKVSRELTKPVETVKQFQYIHEAVDFTYQLMSKYKNVQGSSIFKRWTDYNDRPGFWTTNGWAMLETYYDFLEEKKLEKLLSSPGGTTKGTRRNTGRYELDGSSDRREPRIRSREPSRSRPNTPTTVQLVEVGRNIPRRPGPGTPDDSSDLFQQQPTWYTRGW